MSSGSSACLIARIAPSAAAPCSALEILHLALPDAVLAGAGAFHGERALGQPLDEALGRGDLGRIVHVDQRADVEIAVADMADDRRDQSHLVDVAPGLDHAFGKPRDRHADVGRERRARPAAAPSPPNRRRGAPARVACAPPAWSPIRTDRRRTRRRSRRSARPARRPRPRCRGIRGTASASPAGRASNRRCWRAPAPRRAARCARPGCRTGWWRSPRCRRRSIDSNGQTAAEIASGMPCSLSVSSVMTPSVPSEPTISRVRS